MACANGEVLLTVRCMAYNQGKYIGRCLEGFVSQKTNFRFEVMVHDDASSDNTQEIIREYAAKYPELIKPVFETENLYSRRDGSLERKTSPYMHGKYIAMCEADDYWIDENKLQRQVDYMEQHPECALVCSGAVVVNSKGEKLLRNKSKKLTDNASQEMVLGRNPVITASSCFRREDFEEFQRIRAKAPFTMRMGDYPLWIYLSTKGTIMQYDEPMVAYRELSESASHSANVERMRVFRQNSMEIALWMNEKYGIGVKRESIERSFRRIGLREMSKFDRKVYWAAFNDALREDKRILCDAKIMVITFIRMVLNKRC